MITRQLYEQSVSAINQSCMHDADNYLEITPEGVIVVTSGEKRKVTQWLEFTQEFLLLKAMCECRDIIKKSTI